MSQVHLCNTFFEKELETPFTKPLADIFRLHPVFLQLQFLPLLYAEPDDVILVSDLPENPDPRLALLDEAPKGALRTFGASFALKTWAEKNGLAYEQPAWETVKDIHSKAFSFSASPKLPFAKLLSEEDEVYSWVNSFPGPKVLKTEFGVSGTGHFHIGKSKNLSTFLHKEFSKERSVIGEPWVERVFDFSTQWKVEKDAISLLTPSIFETTPWGSYTKTTIGKSFGPFEGALQEHLSCAATLLKKIQDKGFFGNIGIDSFVYLFNGKLHLHPIVEINARKTMSWVAFEYQRRLFPKEGISFHFSKKEKLELSKSPISSQKYLQYPLLPHRLLVKGKWIHFEKNIECASLESRPLAIDNTS